MDRESMTMGLKSKSLARAKSLSSLGGVLTASAQRSVVGYWKTGGLGMINEVNTVTGQTKNNRGKTFSYKFAADGTYTFVGYMESTMFGCTTGLFNEINGRYLVDGTTIFLKPSRDFWRNTYSCFPNSNRSQEKAPTKNRLNLVLRPMNTARVLFV